MPEERTFSPSVPQGLVVYEDVLDVAGVQHHKPEAMRFLEGSRPFLEFQREPNNEYDPNAIKIMGTSTAAGARRRYHLGYVERSVAAAIAGSGAWGKVTPQLVSTYVGETGFVGIRYRLVGEPGCHPAYHAQFGEVVRGPAGGETLTVTLKGQPKARFETGPLAGEERPRRKSGGCMKAIGLGVAIFLGLALLGTCLPEAGAAWREGIMPFFGDQIFVAQVHHVWAGPPAPTSDGTARPVYPPSGPSTPYPTGVWVPYPPGVPSPTPRPSSGGGYNPYPGVTLTPWWHPTATPGLTATPSLTGTPGAAATSTATASPTATTAAAETRLPTATTEPGSPGQVVLPLIRKR